MKKLLVSFLCIIMVMVFVPTMAFAAENNDYFEVTKNGVTEKFPTAVDAVASVKDGETATIKLLDNYSGGGVKVEGTGKNITFDLNGKTWEIGTPLVGSTGTETNAFQLLKDNTVTFKNGEIKSDKALILIQNYANLTIDNVDLSLTTPGTGNYAASNNNGKTVIKGGSTITVSEGNYAMDSFNFGTSYAGVDVVIEDAYIIGDVEIANGGKIKMTGGGIEGDVIVHNYAYDEHANDESKFEMENGLIVGDVKTSEKGNTTFNGGVVEGTVSLDSSKGAKAVVNNGLFMKVGENVTVAGDVTVDFAADGENVTAVGGAYVEEMLKVMEEVLTPEQLAQVVMTVKKAPAGYEAKVPAGVTVVNSAGNEIVVNGNKVAADDKLVVEKPSTDKPGTGDTGSGNAGDNNGNGNAGANTEAPDKSEGDTPKTGDEANMLPWLALMAAAAGATGIAAFKKRENQ